MGSCGHRAMRWYQVGFVFDKYLVLLLPSLCLLQLCPATTSAILSRIITSSHSTEAPRHGTSRTALRSQESIAQSKKRSMNFTIFGENLFPLFHGFTNCSHHYTLHPAPAGAWLEWALFCFQLGEKLKIIFIFIIIYGVSDSANMNSLITPKCNIQSSFISEKLC